MISNPPMALTLFGLTGGIACGKSTVARFLRNIGVPVIDADQVARDVLSPGTETLETVLRVFGPAILDEQGKLDRAKLGAIVFSDSEARRTLESITHPEIRENTRNQAKLLENKGHSLAAYEAALLIENNLMDSFRPLVVVTADPQVQVERIMQRDGLSASQAQLRLDAQVPVAQKVIHADFVIDSQCTMEELRQRTIDLVEAMAIRLGLDMDRYKSG